MGIKIQDVAYVRFSAPDLDAMEEFLAEFGMVRLERAGDRLYMRGLSGDPFLHITEVGAPGFLAAGFEAASVRDLETLAREVKTSIVASIPITCSCSSRVRLFSYNLFALNYVFTLLWAGQRRPLVREAIAHSRRDSESQLKGIMSAEGDHEGHRQRLHCARIKSNEKKKPGPLLSMGANKVADLDVSAGHLIDCQRVES